MNVRLLSSTLVLASLDSLSALLFCFLGRCISSKVLNFSFSCCTFSQYFISVSSFALNVPVTYPVTNRESLFAFKFLTPTSAARVILAIKASYFAWLLLAFHLNLRNCFNRTPPDPFRVTLASFPLKFEESSMEGTRASSSFSISLLTNSAAKSASACALIRPLGSYQMSYSNSSTDHATIIPARSCLSSTFLTGRYVLTITW